MSSEERDGWILRPIDVLGVPVVIDVPPGGLTIGRDSSCGVVVRAAQYPQVSGQHARVDLVGDALEVTDLGSMNGTLVNGEDVKTRRLASGDVVQLGEHGPRFAAVSHAGLTETMNVAPLMTPKPLAGLGDSTITNIRAAIGAPDKAEVAESVQKSSRRTMGMAVVLSAVVLTLAAFGMWKVGESGRREANILRAMNEQLRGEIAETRDTLVEQSTRLDQQRDAVLAERNRLAERIRSIEAQAGSGATERLQEELSALRGQLTDTEQRLELFDPVNLERDRLRDVSAVHRAIVLIEATTRYRDTESGRLLHVAIQPDGEEYVNLEFEGELVEQESSGSGFCVSTEGHILTNAHVVLPANRRSQISGPDGATFDIETDPHVVFTGETTRYRAEIIEETLDPDEDLALIRINPFDGMPVLEGFTLATPAPRPGTEVYLFGFPLGTLALQEGNRVVASTFKGILSREVGGFLQIDASVHPGNSGGPVTDAHGNVLGIVVQVQGTPSGQFAHSIGYVIPIARASLVWPPD